jgi:hypothetical protein
VRYVYELLDEIGESLGFFASLNSAKVAAMKHERWDDAAYWSDDADHSYCYPDENGAETFTVERIEVQP